MHLMKLPERISLCKTVNKRKLIIVISYYQLVHVWQQNTSKT